MILMAIHVDDCFVIGKPESIKQVVKDIEAQGLKLKTEFNTKDYKILFNKTENCVVRTKERVTTYEELVKGCQSYKAPGTPNCGIVPPGKNDPKIKVFIAL
jgi:hypothetical protein